MSFVPENLDKTAFGELSVAEPTPIAQIMAPYGQLEKAQSFTLDTGTTGADNSLFFASSGAGANALSALLTSRQITYRPGQGVSARFTAIFDEPQIGNEQQAGFITNSDRFVFCFNENQEFGIARYYDGDSEIQELTITTPAAGAENASITVDGVVYVVPLTAGTVQHNAYEISGSLNTQVPNYEFSSNNDQVVARSLLFGANGSFSFTSATAVASWVQVADGKAPEVAFTPREAWNVDSRPDFNPFNGNVFQIKAQYLGFGAIKFYIEDTDSGEFIEVHRIKYAGTQITTTVGNPTFRVGWLTQNKGNTTDVVIQGASAAGFVEGKSIRTESPRALNNTDPAVGTANFVNILTLRNRLVLDGRRNRNEIFPLNLSPSTDSSKGVVIEILANATISGDLDFQYIDKDNSIAEVAIDPGVVSGGRLVNAFTIPAAGGDPINLEELSALLLPGETLTVAARVISGAASSVTASIVWQEDL